MPGGKLKGTNDAPPARVLRSALAHPNTREFRHPAHAASHASQSGCQLSAQRWGCSPPARVDGKFRLQGVRVAGQSQQTRAHLQVFLTDGQQTRGKLLLL